jgi:hypothetical protein
LARVVVLVRPKSAGAGIVSVALLTSVTGEDVSTRRDETRRRLTEAILRVVQSLRELHLGGNATEGLKSVRRTGGEGDEDILLVAPIHPTYSRNSHQSRPSHALDVALTSRPCPTNELRLIEALLERLGLDTRVDAPFGDSYRDGVGEVLLSGGADLREHIGGVELSG